MTTSQKTTSTTDYSRHLGIWGAAQNLATAFFPHYNYITVPYLRSIDILPTFNTLLNSYAYDNFTVEQWVAGVGFQNPETNKTALDEAVQAGFLTEANGAYNLTAKGREGVAGFFNRASEAMKDLPLLTPAELDKLTSYWKRIIDACSATDLPFGKFHFDRSRVTDKHVTDSVIAQIDQYVTDLQFYRDDSHNSAWRATGSGATAWNALSQIWSGRANTAEKIAEAVTARGYGAEVYASALQDLAQRGLVTENNGEYQLTTEGKQLRDQAEYETNRIFFAGWADLSDDELTELENLTKALDDAAIALARRQTWDLMVETTNAYTPLYQEVTQPYFPTTGFQQGDWGFCLDAWALDPTPFNSDVVKKVTPYRNPETWDAMISATAERGFLEPTQGGYKLTEKGLNGVQGFFKVAYDHMGTIETLATERLEGLIGHLKRISDTILAMPEGNFIAKIGHVSINEAQTGPNPLIDQYLTEFLYWRDDAHLAAWQPSGLSGIEWESLSFIWRNQANTAAALAERQGQARAYTSEDYAAAIETLVQKGLVKADGDGYIVTEAGQKVREDIEKKTDEIFFVPWHQFQPGELGQIKAVLGELRDKLIEMQPQAENA